MTIQTVEITGYAARFGMPFTAGGENYTYAASAFHGLLHNECTMPVRIEHNGTLPPLGAVATLAADKSGVRFSLKIAGNSTFARGAILALRHGYLRGASLSIENIQTVSSNDPGGPQSIVACNPRELSLVVKGACPGCYLRVDGGQSARQTLPSNAIEQATLARFLKQVGIQSAEVSCSTTRVAATARRPVNKFVAETPDKETAAFMRAYTDSLLPPWPSEAARQQASANGPLRLLSARELVHSQPGVAWLL